MKPSEIVDPMKCSEKGLLAMNSDLEIASNLIKLLALILKLYIENQKSWFCCFEAINNNLRLKRYSRFIISIMDGSWYL
jgi:hypothetical protein